MKQMQLVFAVLLLAVMVFVVTFAMNYLGGGTSSRKSIEAKPRPELLFAYKFYPLQQGYVVEQEDRGTGHHDYWFVNTNAEPVKLGLNVKNCKCTNVDAYVLPEEASRKLVPDPTLVGPESLAKAIFAKTDSKEITALENQSTKVELMTPSAYATVPPGAVGWVRLNYKGERPGPQNVEAALWMDDPQQGALATLQLRLMFHEPFRVQTKLNFGTLTDDELAKGVTRYLYCLSSTRSELNLKVERSRSKVDPASDPMIVGKPELLGEKERANMQKMLDQASSELQDVMGGSVKSAYRIPVTLNAVSADGKTPIDLGPFFRRLLVTAEKVEGDPKSVLVQGRVRGMIEIGADDDGGELNFRSFRRTLGKREKISLYSQTPGVKLEVDQARMPSFLKATLTPMEGQSSWTLNVEVLPGMASGPFPRKDDPTYEDCAVYLKATIPGKPSRSLRIGVSGTATAR